MTLKWYGDDVARRKRGAAADGLFEAAESLLEYANRSVPLDEGPLQQSGMASVDRANLVAAVSYNTPYSVAQHERLDYQHAPGRRAKFLELALEENRAQLQQHIANKIKAAL